MPVKIYIRNAENMHITDNEMDSGNRNVALLNIFVKGLYYDW